MTRAPFVCALTAAAVVACAGAPHALARPHYSVFGHPRFDYQSSGQGGTAVFPGADIASGLDILVGDFDFMSPPVEQMGDYPEAGMIVSISLDTGGGLNLRVAGGPDRRHSVAMTRAEVMLMGSMGNGDPSTLRGFDMELLALSISGPAFPEGFLLRESPTLASLGHLTIEPASARGSGGGYIIESFFDVFFELSTDGGQNWTPAVSSVRLTGVPTPGPLFAFAMAGAFAARRRR